MFRRFLNWFSNYGAGYARANQLGLRAIGVVYFIAFVSFLVQADGLIGANGILPFHEWLQAIRPDVAAVGYRFVPTLLWLSPTDTALHLTLWAGVACSVLLVLGIAPLLSSAALWLLYLSVTIVGRVFWSFQWDNLLLEAGLLAILASPWRWRMRWRAPDDPSRWVVFLFHLLVFKLMFMAGWVKLASRDPVWWHLTALKYHYWTQPLPIWTAWYADQLPLWFQRFCCFVMFGIELALPFFIWFGARARTLAAAGFVGLMVLIAATGNYTFFNLLTAILCIWLLRDQNWAWLLNLLPSPLRRLTSRITRTTPPRAPLFKYSRCWVWLPALVIAGISTVTTLSAFRAPIPWPGWVVRVMTAAQPFRSVNPYGLFATMTKSRPEIIIEGTWDGERWYPYEFRWKAGDVSVRPRLVAPYQPRLDWQMWFAALGEKEGNPWIINLMVRLMQNEPSVIDLLEYNPFEQRPPTLIRAVRFTYRFATPAEREQGMWWAREFKDLYCPPFRLNLSP